MSDLIKYENLEDKLIEYDNQLVLVDSDVAKLYGVETRDINKAVKNNSVKFPDGYIYELTKDHKNELVENFHRFNKLKHSTVLPKVFPEEGLYMLATIYPVRRKRRREYPQIEANTGFMTLGLYGL